jgi:hypothetical protein
MNTESLNISRALKRCTFFICFLGKDKLLASNLVHPRAVLGIINYKTNSHVRRNRIAFTYDRRTKSRMYEHVNNWSVYDMHSMTSRYSHTRPTRDSDGLISTCQICNVVLLILYIVSVTDVQLVDLTVTILSNYYALIFGEWIMYWVSDHSTPSC